MHCAVQNCQFYNVVHYEHQPIKKWPKEIIKRPLTILENFYNATKNICLLAGHASARTICYNIAYNLCYYIYNSILVYILTCYLIPLYITNVHTLIMEWPLGVCMYLSISTDVTLSLKQNKTMIGASLYLTIS